MNLNAPYTVSEWEWLKLQLRIHMIESRCAAYSLIYTFDDVTGNILCQIWASQGYEQTKVGNKENLKQIYDQNVLFERNSISEIINKLPKLKKEFDLMEKLTIEFLESYGMGSSLICEYKGNAIKWHY